MRDLGKSLLGASVFFASSHPSESCGSNGLPLTPHSIKIVGRFQILKTINHPCLCKYISISRGKQERIIVIAEYYKQNLKILPERSAEDVCDIAFQVFQGLAHLNQLKIVHRCLAPDHILLDTDGRVKLSRFGIYHLTDHGTSVSFNIGLPKYTAPEVLLGGPVSNSTGKIINKSAENVDTWSMGIILLEIATGIELWPNLPLRKILENIFSLVKAGLENFSVFALIRGTPIQSKYELLTNDLKSLIETCLVLDPLKRLKPADILSLQIFRDFGHQIFETTLDPIEPCFPSDRLQCADLVIPAEITELPDDLLSERSLEEVYYLWGLAGGDLEAELRRQGMIKIKSPVCSLPKIIIEEGEMFGQKKDRAFLLDETIVELPLLQLRQRLSTIPPVAYFPLIEDFDSKALSNANHSMNDLAETAKLPLIIREKDIEYQFHRIVLFQRLLLGYPYKRNRIAREARIDVPPLFRGHVWASLLEIDGDIKSEYEHIDKETPTLTDRQIEVDIPRCHQYDELLSSPTGHQKFRRILKAWVISHSQYVYWQGLDSLCAPFLYLNFNDEALAFSCFSAFIDKYLHNFFLKDNSSIIQEYLAVFSHLISFHDPKLSNHLNSIGFIPQLYAIPWFLTMYTHVFPLHKIFHLWDTLLLGNSSFPLCVGVAILQQLRDNLLSFGFNECILLFSDMPEIDIERCVQDSIKIFCSTPKSATYRQHDREESTASENTLAHEIPSKNYGKHPNSELVMDVISFEALTSELNPRISAEELLELLEKDKSNLRSKPLQAKSKLFIVDIRAAEDYFRGAIHDSVNIPFNSAFSPEGNFNPSPEATSLQMNRGRLVIVVAKNHNHAVQFAEQLVRLEFPRVCILHKGFDILRHANILVVPSINLHSPN